MSLLLEEAGSTLMDILYSRGPTWRYSLMVTGRDRRKQVSNKVLRQKISYARCPVSSLLGPAWVAFSPSCRHSNLGSFLQHPSSFSSQQPWTALLFPKQVYSLPNLASSPTRIIRTGTRLLCASPLSSKSMSKWKILNFLTHQSMTLRQIELWM